MMLRRSQEARITLIAAASVAAATAGLQPYGGPWVDAVAAVLLVLVLPGAPIAATFMVFTRPLERAAAAIAGSLAITALTVLALNAAGIQLDRTGLTVGLAAATLLNCLICSLVPASRVWGRAAETPNRSRLAPIWFGAFVLIVVGAGAVSGFSAVSERVDEGFSQLWALPDTSSPTPAAVIGVRNRTGADQEYLARLKLNGEQYDTWGPFELAAGESITETAEVPPSRGRFEVVLRIGEDRAQVRTVHLMFK